MYGRRIFRESINEGFSVYDGPLFKYPIKFEYLNIVKNETHGFLDVKEKEYE